MEQSVWNVAQLLIRCIGEVQIHICSTVSVHCILVWSRLKDVTLCPLNYLYELKIHLRFVLIYSGIEWLKSINKLRSINIFDSRRLAWKITSNQNSGIPYNLLWIHCLFENELYAEFPLGLPFSFPTQSYINDLYYVYSSSAVPCLISWCSTIIIIGATSCLRDAREIYESIFWSL